MNKIKEACEVYTFDFPKPSSFHELLFAPRIVTVQDGTVTERLQHYLIDYGSFATRASKSLNQWVVDKHQKPIFTFDDVTALYVALDSFLIVESMVGRVFYMSITSMVFRSIELFSQSVRNSLSFSVLHERTKIIVDLFIMSAVVVCALYLGYDIKDLPVMVVIPALFDKILSFTWSNYCKQIHTLSSAKGFELSDFISKNIQALFIRMLPPIFTILYSRESLQPAWMTICKASSEQILITDFGRNDPTTEDILLEPIALILGKMIFDLAYILLLKTFAKDPDLRDPMGWMFSKFRRQAPSQPRIEEQKSYNRKKSRKLDSTQQQKTYFNLKDAAYSKISPLEISYKTENCTAESIEKGHKTKNFKAKDKSQTHETSIKKIIKEEVQTSINIDVGGYVRTFQKIENPSFNKEVWGVIIADSVENQKLDKYERLLSNGTIGGGIRQLKGGSDRYEIGAQMDSRLIGKMYNNGVYHSLQRFMRLEDALQCSQELESHGIEDDVSLIVFSAEAKAHKDISRVANKL